MPCVEWFHDQDQSYQDSVLPPSVTARVSIEAGIAQPWYRFLGGAGEIVSIEHFGASADYQTLFREFGFTTEHVVEAARRSLANAGSLANVNEHQPGGGRSNHEQPTIVARSAPPACRSGSTTCPGAGCRRGTWCP